MNLSQGLPQTRIDIIIIEKCKKKEREGRMSVYKSVILSLFMLVIGSGCCNALPTSTNNIHAKNQLTDIQIIKHIEDSTVALVIGPPGVKSPYCAGVWIDNTRILTAAHCAEIFGRTVYSIDEELDYNSVGDPAFFINKSDIENNEIPQDHVSFGIVKKIDKQHDLALIESVSETSYHSIATLTPNEINTGEMIHMVGHPVGLVWTYTHGFVGAIRNSEGPSLGKQQVVTKAIQASAPIWVGNSGGGAFSADGYLIGICSWINLRGPNIAYFIHKDEIKNFLESN